MSAHRALSISTILGLVGDLKDNDPAQIRFRNYLEEEVKDLGLVRDFINECLVNTGDQYNFAFQDLVIYLGKFLGFSCEYGRYRGTADTPVHDGVWVTRDGFYIVIEVKKTEVYAVRVETLLGYVESLISSGSINNWDSALGLYVVGRLEPELKQIENNIIGRKAIDRLRIVSADALISLTEIANEFDVDHEDVLSILKPAKPLIDPAIDLLTRVIQPAGLPPAPDVVERPGESVVQYWITPVKSTDEETAEECINKLVGEERIYAFGERTPGRASIKVGDKICFYAAATGVVAHAVVASLPEKKPHPKVRQKDKYPWVFKLKNPKLYVDEPTAIDAAFRSRLEAFEGKDVVGHWAWFVQATHRLTAGDFKLLTRAE